MVTKPKRKPVAPSIRVYQGDNDKQLFDTLKQDAKKYGMSISSLAVFAIEAGLGVVEHHFDEMKSKGVRERQPTKK